MSYAFELYPYLLDANTYSPHRCFRLAVGGAYGVQRVVPSAGADVDGVSGSGTNGAGGGLFACPGLPVQVEASAAFSSGALLECLADGRVKQQAGGIGVLRALESSAGSGSIVWACFTSGR